MASSSPHLIKLLKWGLNGKSAQFVELGASIILLLFLFSRGSTEPAHSHSAGTDPCSIKPVSNIFALQNVNVSQLLRVQLLFVRKHSRLMTVEVFGICVFICISAVKNAYLIIRLIH